MSEHIIVAELTTTQRLVLETVEIRGQQRLEFRKEWRRNNTMDWKATKGITIPRQYIPKLVEALQLLQTSLPSDNE